MAKLERLAARRRPRIEKLEAQLERERAGRDREIREAFAAGVPVMRIAEAYGMFHQRVSQIVRDVPRDNS